MDAKVSLEVLHTVELSVADGAAERAAARREKLQSASPAARQRLLIILLELLLALPGVLPQQAEQLERLTAAFAGIRAAEPAARPTAGHVTSISLRRGFWGRN